MDTMRRCRMRKCENSLDVPKELDACCMSRYERTEEDAPMLQTASGAHVTMEYGADVRTEVRIDAVTGSRVHLFVARKTRHPVRHDASECARAASCGGCGGCI
jgi:hypothetical protein